MKGGHTPIHIMRFAPADYVNDPFVRRLYQRRDYRTAAFYPAFLFWSHMEGGDLPADPGDLGALLLMPVGEVVRSLAVCKEAGKIREEGGRLYHKRVKAEVDAELAYRRSQQETGRKGGRPPKHTKEEGEPKGRVSDNQTPSSPSPAPLPASLPADDEGASAEPSTDDGFRCPDCRNRGTLRRGSGGTSWFCGQRVGGCGAQFKLDDPAILRQLTPNAQQGIRERVAREPPQPFLRGVGASRRQTAAEITLAAVRGLSEPEES